MTHALGQPDWRLPAQLQATSNELPWELHSGISVFPTSASGEKLAPAKFHSDALQRPSTDSSTSDLSKQKGSESLSLKEKNRRAQQKFRDKQKVSTADGSSTFGTRLLNV